MDWSGFPKITEDEARDKLAPFEKRLLTPDDQIGVEADPEVFIYGGGIVVPEIRVDELSLPARAGTVFIDGNVHVDGLLSHAHNPVFIAGNLRARCLYTDSCLAVMGDLHIEDVFYGCCTNYCTHIFGRATVGTLLLDKNHHYIVHGKSKSKLRLEDEVDGYDAIPTWLVKAGVLKKKPKRTRSKLVIDGLRARCR